MSPRKQKISYIIHRFFLAFVIYLAMIAIFSSVHDYPITHKKINEFRQKDLIIINRQWIMTFYFFNESASGIKFFITGDERHMRFFPSPSHIINARLKAASNGDWQKQVLVGQMYLMGSFVEVNLQEGIKWLRLAEVNAPIEVKGDISRQIAQALNSDNHP